jgi:hypothetical protein
LPQDRENTLLDLVLLALLLELRLSQLLLEQV